MAVLPVGSVYLTGANGLNLYYVAIEMYGGGEAQLYSSDGTPDGAVFLINMPYDNTRFSTAEIEGAAIIVDLTGTNYSVYGTDGTVVGTQTLFTVDVPNGLASSVGATAEVNGREIVFAVVGGNTTVYGTNGTAAGTQQLFDFNADQDSEFSLNATTQVSGRQIIVAQADGDYTVYGTDGTTAGAQQLLKLDAAGLCSSFNGGVAQVNGREILFASMGTNLALVQNPLLRDSTESQIVEYVKIYRCDLRRKLVFAPEPRRAPPDDVRRRRGDG
jgi:hypothetical protein